MIIFKNSLYFFQLHLIDSTEHFSSIDQWDFEKTLHKTVQWTPLVKHLFLLTPFHQIKHNFINLWMEI